MTVSRSNPSDLFSGGGELGERMAAMDWASTPLGPVDAWPQSLKTCVRIVLTSRQPMFVWWGEALVNLYNDAYISILGGKHPVALGQPASLVWREIWDAVEPRAAMAMERNVGTYDEALPLVMERNGYPEETYYTFSYSPVPNDHGGTGGILCANTDDTLRILGERRLATLRELSSRTADARTKEDACLRAAEAIATNDRDFTFASLYLLGDDRRATLSATVGVSRGHALAPESIGPDGAWSLADTTVRTYAIEPTQDPPRGRSDRPSTALAIVPIAASGQSGVLVVGLNPLCRFDEAYCSFLELAASQIGASLANAEAYQEERRRAEALAAIDRAKTAFFSNVSHEFRTPLTLMLGPTEDALASPQGVLAGKDLETVHRNELRLLRLVNTLLDFSRVEAGRVAAQYEPTDLAALTLDLASVFRSAVEKAGLRYVLHCARDLPELCVDRQMWEKIVLNLLSNALKFTFDGSIEVDLREAGDDVVLSVRDTGVGVAPDQLPRLFERFHRIEGVRARTHEGSGIGLALVAELVRLHGGTVRAESEPDVGTTIYVSVPKGSAHLPAEQVGTASERGPSITRQAFADEAMRWIDAEASDAFVRDPDEPIGAEQATRILLADDNADMREYVGGLLRAHWTVEAVADGRAALEAARVRRPDLVLTDVMMPELDGFGLLHELRGDPATRTIPVVMLSARAGEESRIEGLQAGADDYLVKPFSARELVARVRTHVQLAALRRAAEKAESDLRTVLLQAPVAIAVFRGPELVIELANERYEQVTSRTGLAGKPLLEALPELRGQSFDDLLRRVMHTRSSHVGREVLVKLEHEGVVEDRYFTFVYAPLVDAHGRADRVMVVCQDETERIVASRRIEEARALEHEARSRAEEASRAKDEFLAMLGHELRNPLSPIVTALELIRMRGPGSAEREHAIIARQIDHLVRLVDDLLDVSRITRGKIELRTEPIEFAQVAAKAVEMASPLLEQRRHDLHVDVPSRGLRLEADAIRLAQVVSNLLNNAARYTDPGGRVELAARRENGELVVTVRDTGVGIDPELLPRIFERFTQGLRASDRAEGGLGLGLALVRSLVHLHGGRVAAHSEGRGRGSTFTVRLPALAETGEHVPDARVVTAPPSSAAPHQGRVLVVDDNADAAMMLAEIMRTLGYEVAVAHDGAQALGIVDRFHPDLAVLDIGLPVLDGYELAERLRERRGAQGCRMIALTGYGQPHDHERSRAAGFAAHLVKPVELATLVAALRSESDGASPR